MLSFNGKKGNVVLEYQDISEILQSKLSTINGKSILNGGNIEIGLSFYSGVFQAGPAFSTGLLFLVGDDRACRCVVPEEDYDHYADGQCDHSGQQICLPVAEGLTVIDDGGDDLGCNGTAKAVGGHHNAGVPADILMEPSTDNGTGHGTAYKYDANTVESAGNIEMQEMGGDGTEQGSTGQSAKAHDHHFLDAKPIDQHTEIQSDENLRHIPDVAGDGIYGPVNVQGIGDGGGVQTRVAAAKAQAEKLHQKHTTRATHL